MPEAGASAGPPERDALLRDLLVPISDVAAQPQHAERALTEAIAWLHDQIQRATALPDAIEENAAWSDSGPVSEDSGGVGATAARPLRLEDLRSVFERWNREQQQDKQRGVGLPLPHWLLWVELGCCIGVLEALQARQTPDPRDRRPRVFGWADQAASASLLPAGFPTASSHCDANAQIQFSVRLWDAVVARPLSSLRPVGAAEFQPHRAVVGSLLRVFSSWTARAMVGYETVFLANVSLALQEYIQSTRPQLQITSIDVVTFTDAQIALGIERNAGAVAVAILVASSLCDRPEMLHQVDAVLEPLLANIAVQFMEKPFPLVHEPLSIVAASIGMAAWIHEATAFAAPSWTRAVLQLVAFARVLLLPLMSPRINQRAGEVATIQVRVQNELRQLIATASQENWEMVDLTYRVIESSVMEAVAFFQTTWGSYEALLAVMESTLPSELFRPTLAQYRREQKEIAGVATPTPELVSAMRRFLQQFYDGLSPILADLSTCKLCTRDNPQPNAFLVRSFTLLSRLEFAREVDATTSRNAPMNLVTQRIEETVDQAPDFVFGAILRSVAASSAGLSAWPGSFTIPTEMDVILSCQALTVGLLVQRKLRTLLFQSSTSTLLDDALAAIFLGVNSAFQPLDEFSHRFIGACLTHLGQFVSVYTIIPYYVQLNLAAFPTTTSQETVAKVCGTVFGSLFYSETAHPPVHGIVQAAPESSVSPAHRMVLWVMKAFLNRSAKLLLEKPASDSTPEQTDASGAIVNSDGIYLVGLVAEILKLNPLELVPAAAMELEQLVSKCATRAAVCKQVKQTIFTSVSQNCEAEKRAWLAAWFIELDNQYRTESEVGTLAREHKERSRL